MLMIMTTYDLFFCFLYKFLLNDEICGLFVWCTVDDAGLQVMKRKELQSF